MSKLANRFLGNHHLKNKPMTYHCSLVRMLYFPMETQRKAKQHLPCHIVKDTIQLLKVKKTRNYQKPKINSHQPPLRLLQINHLTISKMKRNHYTPHQIARSQGLQSIKDQNKMNHLPTMQAHKRRRRAQKNQRLLLNRNLMLTMDLVKFCTEKEGNH